MSLKLYTGKGDLGQTQVKNCTVSKSDVIIKIIGEIDEFQAEIGLAKVLVDNPDLEIISHMCYLMIGNFSGYSGEPDIDICELERKIDIYHKKSRPHPGRFISPGSNPIEAQLNKCRVKCRRLERLLVKNGANYYIPYINRLSSLLYGMGWFYSSEDEKIVVSSIN